MTLLYIALLAGLIAFSGAVRTFSDAAVIIFFTLLGFGATALMGFGRKKNGYRHRFNRNRC